MGGSLYCRPNTESVSLLRLYSKDFPGFNLARLSPVDIRQLIGITGKDFYFRLVAVCFQGAYNSLASGNGPVPTTLEFAYGGTSFSIAGQSIKPARVRVPQKNYVAGQWWLYNGSAASPVVTPTIGAGSNDVNLYSISPDGLANQNAASPVQYVDIAIRY